MSAIVLCLLMVAADPPKQSARAVELLQALHLEEGARWQMYLDTSHKTKAEMNKKPVYIWTNPTRSGGQNGAVYVWTYQGRPQVIGSIFSHPEEGRRVVCHEFHSLATTTLHPERESAAEKWEPKAGIKLEPLKGFTNKHRYELAGDGRTLTLDGRLVFGRQGPAAEPHP